MAGDGVTIARSRGLTRRSALALATLSPIAARAADGVPSLCQAAAQAGLLYGSDSDSVIAHQPAEYARLICRHCNLVAPLFQWQLTQKHANGPDPGWEDPNIQFARQNGMRLTGGHFIWHDSVPDWFSGIGQRDQAERAIVQHIVALGSAYAGSVFAWNVVNEAIDPRSARPDGLRRSVFLDLFGEAFFEIGFHAARAADPSALLVYNDYGMEMATAEQEHRRRALIMLLDRLLHRRVPIDAIGLQAHLRLDGQRFDDEIYRAFLQEISDRGVRIMITELDVLDHGRGRDITTRDAEIADLYARFLAVALDQKAVISLVTWGLTDRYTWLSPTVSPRLHLPAGPPARPLPFDSDFEPKPAYHSILRALQRAPRRPLAHSL
jgi:endo-1,4-beta-xylanase